MNKTISVKELRMKFPEVRKGLSQGINYTLIHRSKPIGEILPLPQERAQRRLLDFLANPPKEMLFRSRKSAVQLVREQRDD